MTLRERFETWVGDAVKVLEGHLLILIAAGALVSCGIVFVAVVLWPRSLAPAAATAPSVPITVAGAAFNVPSAAIRVPVQRRPGAQDRVDLNFLWPSLTPPDPEAKPTVTDQPPAMDRIFLTIAAGSGGVAPSDLTRIVYPRFLSGTPHAGPAGLASIAFRDGTPYQGEDLLYDPNSPEKFVTRCSRPAAAVAPGMCLLERRVGAANVTVRFPREWLADWQRLDNRVDHLIARLRTTGG